MKAVATAGRAGDVLIVFLKAPRAGSVKTRLARSIGDRAAAQLYRLLAAEEVRRTQPASGEYEQVFFFSPAEALPEMEAWMPGQRWIVQEGEDLGGRMAHAFALVFGEGARRAAIIGSDAPWVSADHVRSALRALDDHHLVLGPARDGGYYLLALARPQPALFEGVAWSTASVLTTTIEKAGALGLTVRLLEAMGDIDTLEDVRREWDRLRPLIGDGALLAKLAAAIRG